MYDKVKINKCPLVFNAYKEAALATCMTFLNAMQINTHNFVARSYTLDFFYYCLKRASVYFLHVIHPCFREKRGQNDEAQAWIHTGFRSLSLWHLLRLFLR